MTSHDTRDPAAERMARMTEDHRTAVLAHISDGTCSTRYVDDHADLLAFARDVLNANRVFYRDAPHLSGAIRDAAARHLGGQQP